jgi:hypothetical protein
MDRAVTPPRVRDHKPPLPEGPPPKRAAAPTTAPTGGDASADASHGLGSISPVGGAGTAGSRPSSISAPTMHGYLTKKGEVPFLGRRTWKRRYFVLTDGVLSYYESQAAFEGGKPAMKGNAVRVASHTLFVFAATSRLSLVPLGHVTPPRTWAFRAESKADLTAWSAALSAAGAKPGSLLVGATGKGSSESDDT